MKFDDGGLSLQVSNPTSNWRFPWTRSIGQVGSVRIQPSPKQSKIRVHIPENLSQKGKILLSRKQIRQEMGNLFITRKLH